MAVADMLEDLQEFELIDADELPKGFRIYQREVTQQDRRGNNVVVERGFLVCRKGKTGHDEFAGKTHCWSTKPAVARPMFESIDEAVRYARWTASCMRKSRVKKVDTEVKEVVLMIAKELPGDSTRQIHCSLDRDEAAKLHGLYVACRQENLYLDNGRPIVSKADAIRYLLSLI